ncbi:hypothetical protein MNEG_13395, partial [Monoraphidium neglectum]
IETYLKASAFRQKVQAAKQRLGQAQAGAEGGAPVGAAGGGPVAKVGCCGD